MKHTSCPVEIVGRFDPNKAELFAGEMFESLAAVTRPAANLEGAYQAYIPYDELREKIDLDLGRKLKRLRFVSTLSKFPSLVRPYTTTWHIETMRNRMRLPINEFTFLIGVSSIVTKVVEGQVDFGDDTIPESDLRSEWSRPAYDLMTVEGQKQVEDALSAENPSAKLSNRFGAGDVIYLPKGVIHRGSEPEFPEATLPMYRYALNGFFD